MKKTAISLTIYALISGCTSISNITNDPSFAKFAKSDITLNNQVLVCKDMPLHTGDGLSIEYQLIYNVNLIVKCPFGDTIGLLPEGSEIRIEEIEEHKIFAAKIATHVYFLGNANLQNGELFEFYYLYILEGFYEHQPW